MNILDHIKAGNYPKDNEGRSIIQRSGFFISPVTVLATTPGARFAIVTRNSAGHIQAYSAQGDYLGEIGRETPLGGNPSLQLQAPEPIEVVTFAIYDTTRKEVLNTYDSRASAEADVDADDDEVVVELKGSVFPQ